MPVLSAQNYLFGEVSLYTTFAMASVSIGKIPGLVAAQAFAEWVSDDSEARAEWLQSYLSIVDASKKKPNTLGKQETLSEFEMEETKLKSISS